MTIPLISIIIPVYNTEKYLKQCLDSVVNQTYDNLEIIIVNDGSTDNSLDIIKSYKDKRIKLINKDNGGVSSARNEGLKQATGEYIMFVDSDDYLSSSSAISELITDNDIDVIRYNYQTVNNEATIENNFICSFKNEFESGESFLLSALDNKKDYGWYLWQYMFKRNLWKDIRFPNIHIFEDMSTIFKVLLKANKVGVRKSNVYTYRENDASVSKNVTLNKCKELIQVMKESINYIDSSTINNELKKLLKNNISYGYVTEITVSSFLSNNEKKELNKLLLENNKISHNILFGKQRIIMKAANIFGLNFVEYIIGIRNRVKH